MLQRTGMLGVALLTSYLSFADGKVIGKVTEANHNDVVIAADVSVFKKDDSSNIVTSTFTDVDGSFELTLPAGTYDLKFEYDGYVTKIVENLVIVDDKDATIAVVFKEIKEDALLTEVVVRSTVQKETVAALYSQQKNAATIGDGISSDIISKSPDKNTGEILKRVSGTTIQDNKFVVVRGMNDRYNIAMVDGSLLPSTEPNRKAFSFDIIPSVVIDNIIITKSGSADLPGDFSGGAINILTKEMPNKKYTTVSLSTGYNSYSTFKDFRTGFKSATDFLGFDDGSRQLPAGFPTFAQINDPSIFNPNNSEQSRNYLSQLNNDYSINQRKALPNIGLQLAHGRSVNLSRNRRLGINAGLTYGHEERIRPDAIRQYGNFDYVDNIYNYQTNVGLLLNLGYYTDKSKILFKNLYNRVFDDRLMERSGTNYSFSKNIRYTAFDLLQKSLLKSTLIGEHTLNDRGSKIDWSLSYNLVTNNQPDQKKTTYSRNMNSSDAYFADITNLGKSNNRLFGDMNEHIVNASLNFSQPVNFWGASKFKAGLSEQVRMRNFSNRYVGAVLNMSNPDANEVVNTPLENLYSQSNIDKNYFQFVDQTTDADMYDAQAFTTAAYAMMDHLIQDKYRLAYGVRAEHYFINLNSYSKNEVNTSWLDVLPSLNFTYLMNDKTNLRASYFRSLVRPELREMANMAYYDYEMDAIITGNTSLSPTKIHNIDLKYEYFPNPGEILSASIFYKHFTNTIENNLYGSNSAYDVTPRNFEGGYNVGLEFEIRKNLRFLAPGSFLKNFTFYTNVSMVKSEIKLPDNYFIQGILVTQRPLTGQSPFVVNSSLGYLSNNEKFGVNVLYNYLGRNMYMVGNDIIGHVYVNSRHILDMQASYNFNEKFSVRLTIKDLLNSPFTYFMDQDVNGKFERNEFVKGSPIQVDKDWIWQEYRPGTSLGLSLNYTF